ncbi:MAG: hypothetical protein HQ559_16495 [Lentisphaerae bacterium]|nr:hypothetical protein [Lentisphaerota bacterium]
MIAIAGALLFAGAACGEGPDPKIRARIEEWELAALNREIAAATQEDQAETMLVQGAAFRMKEFLNEAQRRKNLNRAGDLEKGAADKAGAALGNFDRAATNWDKLAKQHAALGEKKLEADARVMAILARERSLACCEFAAEAYEQAAQAYSEPMANQLSKAASASERAASWRERLANRR